jgi:Holliday junction resolvase RusA-like endonuclease
MTALAVTVLDIPIGQGRVTTYGRGQTVHSNAKTLKPWREKIARHVREEMAALGLDIIPKEQPVELRATFTLPRPVSVPERSRWAPVVRPDLDHYVRALCDSLKDVLEDDSQIVSIYASKVYAVPPALPGVTFTVTPAERGEAVAA